MQDHLLVQEEPHKIVINAYQHALFLNKVEDVYIQRYPWTVEKVIWTLAGHLVQ